LNKKIISIVVCMLFLIPLTVVAQNIDKERPLTMITYDESVPTWSEGDSWTYEVDFSGGILDVLGFEVTVSNLKLTVDSVTSSEYNMNVEGDVTGEISIKKFQIVKGKITDTTITGNAVYSTSNIGIKELDAQLVGKFQLIPGQFIIDMTLQFIPAYNPVSWPLSVGKDWNIPVAVVNGKLDLTIAGEKFFDDLDVSNILGGQPVECTGIESKTVGAGTYDAYKVEGIYEEIEFFYAADAGNLINIHAVSDDYVLDMDLKSTTYSGGGEPGAPNKPSKPSGPSSGSPGTEYTYSSSVTDPEGDDVYYWFDWGDGSNSGWLGPFSSGTGTTASHSWDSKRTYSIKVKAKDDGGHVSVWSDPLSVSMPRNKFTNTYLVSLFELFLTKHPILCLLLKI